MKRYKFESAINGALWLQLTKPCVYSWFRGTECLYIGQSKKGFIRILNGHHVINKKERVLLNDRFAFYYIKDSDPNDNLDFVEESLIKFYKPFFNITKNPFYDKKNITRDKVQELRTGVQGSTEVAKVLLRDLPERLLLENTQDYRNLSGAELEQHLQDLRLLEANFHTALELNDHPDDVQNNDEFYHSKVLKQVKCLNCGKTVTTNYPNLPYCNLRCKNRYLGIVPKL